MAKSVETFLIRPPQIEEAPLIKALIDGAARSGDVLPRSQAEILHNLALFRVYVTSEGVGGCCALHPDTADLAEVRSIIVRPELRGQGVGSHLVADCATVGRALGMKRIYALTRARRFFESLDFYEIDMGELPQKVFRDCLRCHLYPNCNEIAMVRDL